MLYFLNIFDKKFVGKNASFAQTTASFLQKFAHSIKTLIFSLKTWRKLQKIMIITSTLTLKIM
jgi:hypothetical protein